MKNLRQEMYEDDNGNPLPAEKVDYLIPYEYIADGFLNWECAKCKVQHSTRLVKVNGVAVRCGQENLQFDPPHKGHYDEKGHIVYVGGCGAMNLLVRTDCNEIAEALSTKWQETERWKESERIQDIAKFNKREIDRIARQFSAQIGATISSLTMKMVGEVDYPVEEKKEPVKATDAKAVVLAIIEDLSDRRGLKQEWRQIDEDVQREIVEKWTKIVAGESKE